MRARRRGLYALTIQANETPRLFRVAIAGCHRMLARTPGGHNWASAFDAVPETRIVAVFDRGREARDAFVACWGKAAAYDDFRRMVEEVRPDIVCIATRQTMHAEQAEIAAAAGIQGILFDKPLATSLEEADRIIACCRHHKVTMTFGLDRRWYPSYRFLRKVISEGSIGTLTGLVAYGLPNLINHGCHWYDTLLLLAGDPEPLWVSGEVEDLSSEPAESRRRMDPSGRALIGLAGGAVAYASPDRGAGLSFDILGDRGRLLILDDARECYLWSAPAGSGPGAAASMRPLSLSAAEPGWPAGPAAVRELIHAVRTGTETSCGLDQARRATEIGFAVHLSHAAHGGRVFLPVLGRRLRIPSFPWGNE